MKSRLILLLVLPLFCALSISATAQSQKLGHINSIDLFTSLPDWKIAEQNLETYALQLQKKLSDEEALLLKEYEAYRKKLADGGMTPNDAKTKEKEIQDWDAALQQKRLDAQKSIADKENELFLPIKENVNTVIQEFMQEENYAYVFDTAQGNVAIGPLGEDVTDKIKSRLGVAE